MSSSSLWAKNRSLSADHLYDEDAQLFARQSALELQVRFISLTALVQIGGVMVKLLFRFIILQFHFFPFLSLTSRTARFARLQRVAFGKGSRSFSATLPCRPFAHRGLAWGFDPDARAS
jgi:hypothetical protein